MRLLRSLSMLMALSSPMALVPAQAQDAPVHLKLAHWAPTTHSLQKAIEDWGSSLQQATSGIVTFTIYPAQQLGKAFDHYDMARDGIADVADVNPGYQPGRFPIVGDRERQVARVGRRRATSWRRAWRMPSPFLGGRCCCSAWTR